MNHLVGSIKYYGFWQGLSLYVRLKNFNRSAISIRTLPHEVHVRPGTTDICVFKQIFLKQDLNIPALDDFTPAKVLDLGANIGMSSLYFAARFPDAEVVGVEPDPSNAEMFMQNLDRYPNVDVVQGAVRGTPERVMISDYGRGASGYMTEPASSAVGVRAITIPELMARHNWDAIDIVKMDIEGSEKSVFEHNVEAWLPKTRMLFVELHERKAPGCTQMMEQAIEAYDFEWSTSGEYMILINRAFD